jgi:hypothetical protein
LFWGTVIALCTAFGGQSLASVPAAAAPSAVSGYTYVQQTSAFNSTAARSVSAYCPRGKVILAGGAYLVRGGRGVLLRGSYPVHSFFGDRWTASAQELNAAGTSTRWQIGSYAVCANKPAGLTYAKVSSVSDSNGSKSVQRKCPASTRLIGLGARVTGADYRVGLNAVSITQGLSASARASKASATLQRWAVESHAVCANSVGQAFRQTGRWIRPGLSPSVTVVKNCPQGTRTFGTGLLLDGSSAALNRLVPVALHPTPSPTPHQGTVTVSELTPGTPFSWGVKAQVLCAR